EGGVMTKNNQDTLARAFAMLSSLRENIANMSSNSVPETYVHEFHAELTRLEGIGIDISQFRIPESEVRPIVIDVSPVNYLGVGGGGGQATYSKEKYVQRPFILTKLDAILKYFEIITSEKPKKIGFSTPDNR
ncbi:MAG TPA: hypothetical protein VJ441_00945, partial [Dehalococcoidia bacterium]|nr:hypothetical protein [Dehalococcoidia bacterium]